MIFGVRRPSGRQREEDGGDATTPFRPPAGTTAPRRSHAGHVINWPRISSLITKSRSARSEVVQVGFLCYSPPSSVKSFSYGFSY